MSKRSASNTAICSLSVKPSLMKDVLGLSRKIVRLRGMPVSLTAILSKLPGTYFQSLIPKPAIRLLRSLIKPGRKVKWTGQHALDLGIHHPETEAVSVMLIGPGDTIKAFIGQFIEAVRQALYASKICSYAQGFYQIQTASAEYGWDINCGELAMLWRGGCIIRAAFLERIKEAYEGDAGLENLLLDSYFREAVASCQEGWRLVVSSAARHRPPHTGNQLSVELL